MERGDLTDVGTLHVGARRHLVRLSIQSGQRLVLVEAQNNLVLDLVALRLTEHAEYLVLAVGFLDDCTEQR